MVKNKCVCILELVFRHSNFGVQRPTKTFFSREDELNLIHKHVCETSDSGNSITVLTGMTGVGKTQLARKYAADYEEHFESVVWVDAASDKIQVSMTKLSDELGLNEKDSHGDPFDIEVVSRKIHSYFERKKTLYIFDNVDDESVKTFEKYVSNKKNAFTLVTSQWKSWSMDVNQVQIDSFSHQNSFLFMKKYIKTNDDEKLKEITEVLQHHPLAINQAILYIKNNSVSLQEYLDLFRSHPVKMLEEEIPTEAETKSAITSINLVLNKIETSNEKSLELLNHLTYCDGQHITKKFIHGISKHLQMNDECLLNHAVSLLVSYSLLDRIDDGRYAMHELTQLACKCYQNRKKRTETCNENIVDFLRLQLEDVKEHVEDGMQFYNHFLHMFHINKSKMCEAFHQQNVKIESFLSNKGFFQEAIYILDAIQNYNTKSYGAENEITLDTKSNIASCFRKIGKYNDALEIYYQVDKIQTDILGINHPSTLVTKHSIASCLDDMGKCNEALEIYYQVDKIQTDILGINHPSTLVTKHSIASCLDDMGKCNEALEIYYQVDKIQTDILGINHPSTLNTKNNIAICLYGMGKDNETLEIYYQVDKIRTDILGINHPSTLNTKNNIAICLNGMGKYNEALEIYYQVDKIRTDILGINHPSTLNTKNNIAICLKNMGKYNEALEIYYQVDKIQTDILGINHPSTLNTKNNTALCLNGMGIYNKALEIYYQVDKIRTDILGINHPSALVTKHSIASCLDDMGKYNEALEIYNQVDKIQTDILGIKHPSTLNTKNNIAICLYGMGKYNEPLEIYYQVDKIQTNILGINHPSTLNTKHNIANCFNGMGKYNEALEIYYQVEKIQTDILGINHPSTLNTKNNIAICLKYMKQREMENLRCQIL